MAKTIDTLVADIDALLENGTLTPDKVVLKELGDAMASLLEKRLIEWATKREPYLRMSMIGKKDASIWGAIKGAPEDQEKMNSATRMKFVYGDMVELVMLAFAQLSGHAVTESQKTVEVEGIQGHIDCLIDGELVDVKSASEYTYPKFEDGSLYTSDNFGYVEQISGYAFALQKTRAHFLAMDKSAGYFCLMTVPSEKLTDAPKRIRYLKEMLAKDTPPNALTCNNPCKVITEGNGNKRLGSPCTYCPHPLKCHPEARVFQYANNEKRVLLHVEKLPRVPEITKTP